MTFHFAYPNVLPRKKTFIGCGRYTVFADGEKVDSTYNEVQGAPLTPNKSNLKRAVQLLAAESYDSAKNLYHQQDNLEETYQGDSLDLAWFLAHILRARKIKHTPVTDIWCTGVIQVDGSGPHLMDVDPTGFALKLAAFLDKRNGDKLFIVPLANLDSKAQRMCENSEVQVVRMGGNEICNMSCLNTKTVLKIPADGLPELLNFLFIPPADGKQKHSKVRFYLLLLLLFGVAGVAGKPYLISAFQEYGLVPLEQPAPPVLLPKKADKPEHKIKIEDIRNALEHGNFSLISDFLLTEASQDDRELRTLRQQLTTPVLVRSKMEYVLADGSKNEVAFDSKEDPPSLTHNDYYRLHIQADTPPGSLYIYLFQVDSKGSLTQLFPSNQFGTVNPVRQWQWPLTIPAGDERWIFLDELGTTDPKQSREIIYLLSSPWQAHDIEALADGLRENQSNEDNKVRLLDRLLLRQRVHLDSINCTSWTFFHGRQKIIKKSEPLLLL